MRRRKISMTMRNHYRYSAQNLLTATVGAVTAALLGGAAYLAVTRAGALLLDVAKIANCF